MCTQFLLTTADKKTHVIGRSMEFGAPLKSKLLIRASKHSFDLGAGHEEALPVTPSYGYVGMTSFGLPLVNDGVNTAGLSIGTLWLPGSVYQPFKLGAINIPAFAFADYALAHFGSVAEVRRAFAEDQVRVIGGKLLADKMPVHFPIVDANGDSVVVEFQDGAAMVRDNPVGVCTNRPFLPWHYDNLANYASLTAWDPAEPDMGGYTPTMNGHGGGLRGIPGDYTPPSRFVRMAYLRQWAETPTTADEAAQLAFHLLNNVDIARGTVRAYNESHKEEQDYTQWVVVKNLNAPDIQIRTSDSPLVYRLSLDGLDFDALNGTQLTIPTAPKALDLPLP